MTSCSGCSVCDLAAAVVGVAAAGVELALDRVLVLFAAGSAVALICVVAGPWVRRHRRPGYYTVPHAGDGNGIGCGYEPPQGISVVTSKRVIVCSPPGLSASITLALRPLTWALTAIEFWNMHIVMNVMSH